MSAEYLRAFVRATDDAPLEVQRSISEIQGKDCEARELLSLIKDMLANLQNVPSDEKKDKLTEIRVSDAVTSASCFPPHGTPAPSPILAPLPPAAPRPPSDLSPVQKQRMSRRSVDSKPHVLPLLLTCTPVSP